MGLVVLYRTKTGDKIWESFRSLGEADDAFDELEDRFHGLEELSRIEINKTATLLFFDE